MTKKKQLQKLKEEYRKSGEAWPATTEDMARWAVTNKRYGLTAPSLIRLVAKELAQALGEEYFTDAQGRRVRANHPARVRRDGKQLVLWDDMRTAPRSHMKRAFQMRRKRIASECKQVKTDVDSYNDAHLEEPAIQMVMDFTDDVIEMELAEKARATRSSSNEPEQLSEQSPDVVSESIWQL